MLPKFLMTNRGLSITLRMLPWSKDTYIVLLPIARTSIRTENKIFLRRLSLRDQFARTCKRETPLPPVPRLSGRTESRDGSALFSAADHQGKRSAQAHANPVRCRGSV